MKTLAEITRRLERQLPPGKKMLPLGSQGHKDFVERHSQEISRRTVNLVQMNVIKKTGFYPVNGFLAFGGDPDQHNGYAHAKNQGVSHVLRLRRKSAKMPMFFKGRFPHIDEYGASPEWEWSTHEIHSIVTRIHQMVHSCLDPRVLVHCRYGKDRSPTAVWMYLQAIGFSEPLARQAILNLRTDAAPGKSPLVKHSEVLDNTLHQLSSTLIAVRGDLFDTLYPLEWPK